MCNASAYQQLELLLAGPGELHGPDPVELPRRHGQDGLLRRRARRGPRVQESLRIVGNAVADGAEVVEGEQDAGLAGAGAQENRRHEQ